MVDEIDVLNLKDLCFHNKNLILQNIFYFPTSLQQINSLFFFF